jgi:hypothetical protein
MKQKPKAEFIGPIQPIWQRAKFPVGEMRVWPKGKSSQEPYCWTPAKSFYFGNKRFVWGYPCIAFETTNFGFVIQKGPEGMTIASE